MISPLESRILDKNSECLGIPVESLMESAGKALAHVVDECAVGKVLFVCGSGNNGGDGYAASGYLRTDCDYTAFRTPRSELCASMSKRVTLRPFGWEILEEYDTIVDCVLGTGIEGELRSEYVKYIDRLNGLRKNVISCDVPSGLGTGKNVIANVTVTFHDLKEGMDESDCGRIVVSDIGIPDEARTHLNRGDFLRYPIPGKDSHKGQNGRVVIIGGGPYVGAPACAGMAAVRAGADLVTILTPKRSFLQISSISASYIVKGLSSDFLCMDDVPFVLEVCKGADAVLIGPGLGHSEPGVMDATRAIVSALNVPTVIDADGINNVAGWIAPGRDMVFTPHSRELMRLMGKEGISDRDVLDFCGGGAVVLRKGSTDVIYGKDIRYNDSGCAGMTVGGTGDVLAGIVVGLLSKGMSAFDSACLGAHICGLAGEMAFEEHSYGMSAEDVISHIGHVLKEGLE